MNRRNDLNNQNLIVKLLNNGINTDVDLELLGSLKKNFCVELENMRPNSDEGNYAALEKIGGEAILYDKSSYITDDHFRCLVAEMINGNLVAVWGGFNVSSPCVITVNSDVVLDSTKLPYNAHSKIQYDFDYSCDGGMLFLTDNVIPPVYLDVQDLIDNKSNEKYFSEFRYQDYTPNIKTSASVPIFDGYSNVGDGGGQPVGMYVYAIRFVTEAGDKSGISPPTPMIPIHSNRRQFTGDLFKGYKTMGADPDPGKRTEYSCKIKFRVVNDQNFDYVEILRTDYNEGAGLGFTPSTKIVDTIDIDDGEISVKTFVDESNPEDHIQITDSESLSSLSVIEAAKSVRYFKSRVNLFNLKYKSAIVDNELEFKMDGENADAYPVMERNDKFGLTGAQTAVYKRPYFHGEKYGFSALVYDSNMQKAFAVPLPGFENFQFPNRRDPLTGSSHFYAAQATNCADVDGNVSPTFELYDMKNAEQRDIAYDNTRINILCKGSKGGVSADGLYPRLPSSPSDERHNHEKRNISLVYTDENSNLGYNPYGFSPEYLSLCFELAGLESWPDWASGFSIVRTERAGRVVCQGIGFYSMNAGDYGSSANTKELNKIWFQSPDILNGIVDSNVISDLKQNPQDYKIQLVSPSGFHMDVYDAERTAIAPSSSKDIDMILHANVMAEYDGKRINIGEPATNIGVVDGNDGYVAYGKWRNPAPAAGSVFDDADEGNQIIGINSVQELTTEEGVTIFDITLDRNIYRKESTGAGSGGAHFNDEGLKEFHEPVYAVNIIKEGADAPQGGSVKYFHTGHFQKFRSKVGESSGGAGESFPIVDERVDDFHTENGIIDKYIYVDDGGSEKRFININNKSASDISTIKNDIDNGTTNYNGLSIYGIYTSTDKEITFSEVNYGPNANSDIIIKYDNSSPVRAAGGDASYGEFAYPFIHLKTDSTNNAVGGGWLYHGMPYHKFSFFENIFIAITADGSINRIQDSNVNELGYVRQMLVNMVIESFSANQFQYNDCFPVVNYVQRPHRWDPSNLDNNYESNGGNVCDDYKIEYPDEDLRWAYGGFHINIFPINIDYSKIMNHEISKSKPETGFTEVTRFCTRVHSSLPKQTGNPNNQRIKTFPPLNIYDVPDKNGEIKRGWSGSTGQQGENLFAFCEKDISLLITDKRILSEKDGGQLAMIGEDQSTFILESIFINEGVGISEKSISLFAEHGNIALFANNRSIYLFQGGAIKDLLKGSFNKVLYHEYIKNIGSSQFNRLTACYDKRYDDFLVGMSKLISVDDIPDYDHYGVFKDGNGYTTNYGSGGIGNNETLLIYTPDYNYTPELKITGFQSGASFVVFNYNINNVQVTIEGLNTYIGTIKPYQSVRYHDDDGDDILGADLNPPGYNLDLLPILRKLFVYSLHETIQNWIGSFSYQFDQYASDDQGNLYGLKELKVFELYKGNTINNSNVVSKASISISPQRVSDKELESIFVNATHKPTKIQILNDDFSVNKEIVAADINDFKHVFQQYAGRRDDNNDRVQGTHFIIRVINDQDQSFVLRSIGAEFKILK